MRLDAIGCLYVYMECTLLDDSVGLDSAHFDVTDCNMPCVGLWIGVDSLMDVRVHG